MNTYLFWGKLASSGAGTQIHPLCDHALDVALVVRRLAELPAFRMRLEAAAGGALADVALDRLSVIALLHDVGKCNRGFQAKRDPDALRITGHVLEATALLTGERLSDRLPADWVALLMEMSDWFVGEDDQLFSMLLAVRDRRIGATAGSA